MGESGYRWTIKGSGDFPGVVDLVYEEWDEENKNWKKRDGIYGISPDVLKRLVSKVDDIVEWEDNDRE